MASNRPETFTDRREAIALFEYLRGRDPDKPWSLLPIVIFVAPGGSGKSTLIEYLRAKKCCLPDGRAALPYVHLDFTLAHAPKDFLSIFVALRNQLQQHSDGQNKHLSFPRFDLGAAIALTTPTEGILPLLSRNEIQQRLSVGLPLLGPFGEMGNALGNMIPIIPPLLVGLRWTGQIPQLQELLHRLERGPGGRWYQRQSTTVGLPTGAGIRDALLRLFQMSIPGRPEREVLVDQVLPAAFLADLLEALVHSDPPQAWSKTSNIVLFLDGFEDLLDSPGTSNTASRLLEALTLTEHRARGETDPLLLVIGSRQRSLLEFANVQQPASVGLKTELRTEHDIGERVRELYMSWQQKLPDDKSILELGDLYLPLSLHDFGQDDTQRYLALLGKVKQTFGDRKLVEAIHRVTHGHPLSLALAAAAFLQAEARGRTLNVERFVEEAVSVKVVPGHGHERIEAYLLDLFLRQLSTSARNELIFCAVPRFLDARMMRAVLQLSTDVEAQERWEGYQRLTFVGSAKNKGLVFHPIVRSLLLRRLLPSRDPESDYYRIHTRLREYFHTWAISGDEQARIEEAYHALALGDPEPAIKLGISAQQGNFVPWEKILEAGGQAPTELMPPDTEKRAYEAFQRLNLYNLHDGVTALVLYTWLLTVFERAPTKVADIQHNSGIAYTSLSRGDRQANLHRAIECYESALTIYARENYAFEWAVIQTDLSEAYCYLLGEDQRDNRQKAIECCEKALQVLTQENHPFEWAVAQSNLGEAYSLLSGNDRRTNLEMAIMHYEAALAVRTRENHPFEWATTQNNLGNAHCNLQGELDLRKAIECYETALTVRTREKYPVSWATTQNNLGNAYRNLQGETNLLKAIECYEAALTVRARESLPYDWAMTQNNLGLAYHNLQGKNRQANLLRAIECYEAALMVRTRESFPYDWAKMQNNIGNTYRDLQGKNQQTNLRRAIEYYEAATEVYTRKEFPLEWAMTQNNLGLAYRNLQGEDQQANLRKAIQHYQTALTVRTRDVAPVDRAKTLNNLGDAHNGFRGKDRRWNLSRAVQYYKEARDIFSSRQMDSSVQNIDRKLKKIQGELSIHMASP